MPTVSNCNNITMVSAIEYIAHDIADSFIINADGTAFFQARLMLLQMLNASATKPAITFIKY